MSFNSVHAALPRSSPSGVPDAKPNPFDAFPNELIAYMLSFSPPIAIIQFASTSRRHRSIATTDQLWFPLAFSTIQNNVDPNTIVIDEQFMRSNYKRLLASLRLKATAVEEAWYLIATKLLEKVEWVLGWWLEETSDSHKGRLWRIFIKLDRVDPAEDDQDARFLSVVTTWVEVSEDRIPLPQVDHPLSIASNLSGITSLELMIDNWDGPSTGLLLEGFLPLNLRVNRDRIRFGRLVLDADEPRHDDWDRYAAERAPDRLGHLPFRADPRTPIINKSWSASFSDAPYPPPLLSNLLIKKPGQGEGDQTKTPSILLSQQNVRNRNTSVEHFFFSIHRPSSFPKLSDELVHEGIYVAPYGSHGWEYLFVRVRELTDEDFQVSWPWEGSLAVVPNTDGVHRTDNPDWRDPHSHLGPFSGITPTRGFRSTPIRVSKDHVRIGSKVLEGIKIQGDNNVPGGQRSFIAFLNDPLVEQEQLRDAESNFPEQLTYEKDVLHWPFVRRLPTGAIEDVQLAYQQHFFAPERGIDAPGVMRVAHSGFRTPQWTPCVAHVECKTSFAIASFGAVAMVFKKLEDWGVRN
ncbi:hypothetical protein FRB90_002644 [Tulasnella sp. 427]|nr:hypothetical protein FRB90_002644 [Tulasnella sp. 427]